VVIGQVMTYNDPDFSVFWTRGPSVGDPPTSSTLRVGKDVGQDPDTTRADETVGYIVIEAGNGTMDGVKYTAGLGADTVVGVDDGPPVSYPLSGLTSAGTALVSQAGMDGNDGSWAILAGSNPVTATSLNLSVDEDQLADSERLHTTEQVAYLVFEDTGASGASFVTGDSKPGESLSTTQPEGSEEGATGRSSPPTGGVSKADGLASRPGQGTSGTVLLVSPAQRKPDLFTMLDQEVGQRSPSVALSLGGVRDMGVSGSVSLPQVAGTPFATDPSQPALVPLSLLVGRQDSAKVFRPGGQDVVVGGPLLQAEATPREAQPDHVEPDAVGAGREDTAVLDRLFSGEAEETAWGSDWLDEVFREGLYP
jgi:hypothetical protein